MIVRESINFERGQDPKKNLKIGVLYSPKNFPSALSFAKFLFDHLEEITGFKPTSKLANPPKTGAFYTDEKFWLKLKSYFLECPHSIRNKPINDSLNMTYWSDINTNLRRILLSLNENLLKFERGMDPKVSIGIGTSRIPQEGDSFLAYAGPETGWVKVIALEDPEYHEERVLTPEHYNCWVKFPGLSEKVMSQYWPVDNPKEYSRKWWLCMKEVYQDRKKLEKKKS